MNGVRVRVKKKVLHRNGPTYVSSPSTVFHRDRRSHSMQFIGILWDLTMPKWDCIPLQRCVIEGVFDRLNQEQREMLLEGAHGRRTALNSVVKGYKEEKMKDKKLPSPRTIRRWINCYLLNGETPEESKRKTGKRKRQSRWRNRVPDNSQSNGKPKA